MFVLQLCGLVQLVNSQSVMALTQPTHLFVVIMVLVFLPTIVLALPINGQVFLALFLFAMV